MISVKFYGMLREDYQAHQTFTDMKSIKMLIKAVEDKTGKYKLKHAIIFVNEVNIMKLKKFNTPLKDGDVISFISPASGG